MTPFTDLNQSSAEYIFRSFSPSTGCGQPDLADYLWRGRAPYHVVGFSTSDVYFRLVSRLAEGNRIAVRGGVLSDVNLYYTPGPSPSHWHAASHARGSCSGRMEHGDGRRQTFSFPSEIFKSAKQRTSSFFLKFCTISLHFFQNQHFLARLWYVPHSLACASVWWRYSWP